MIYVRWLGAFGHGKSLEESLRFEITKAQGDFACEPISGYGSCVHAKVGLLVSPDRIFRNFDGDVWSVKLPPRRKRTRRKKGIFLVATRKPNEAMSCHREAWLSTCSKDSAYTGIVFCGNWKALSRMARQTILQISKETGLKIYCLHSWTPKDKHEMGIVEFEETRKTFQNCWLEVFEPWSKKTE